MPLKAILTAFYREGPAKFSDRYTTLHQQPGYGSHLAASLGLLALQERRPDVLKLCLSDRDVWKNAIFQTEAERVDKTRFRETASLLEASRLPDAERQAREAREEAARSRAAAESIRIAGVFDEGGDYPVKW